MVEYIKGHNTRNFLKKKNTSEEIKKENNKWIGMIFVGLLILGWALGVLIDNLIVGLAIGFGSAFIVYGALHLMREKLKNK